MPHSLKLNAYPSQFEHILHHFTSSKEPLRLEFASSEVANRTRFLWYGYRRALCAQIPSFEPLCDKLRATISNSTLIFTHIDASEIALAFNNSLGLSQKQKPLAEPTTVSLAPKASIEDPYAAFIGEAIEGEHDE